MDGNALVEELEEGPAPRRQLTKLRYTHRAMVDMIVGNPGISQGDLAAAFGMSQSWVSTIMATDAFQAKLDERWEELVDPETRATLRERFLAATHRSLQVLQEKLSRPAPEIPDNLVLRAIELGAKGLSIGGFAPSVPPAPPAPSGDRLALLAERLLALQGEIRKPVDAVIIQEIPHGETMLPISSHPTSRDAANAP